MTVPLGGGGTLLVVYNGAPAYATTHAIFDVTGYFVAGSSGALFVPLTPNRILDSRYGSGFSGRLATGLARSFGVANRVPGDVTRNVPSKAIAVTGNLTVTGPTRSGWLTVTPYADNHPPTSTLNFPVGDNRANTVEFGIGIAHATPPALLHSPFGLSFEQGVQQDTEACSGVGRHPAFADDRHRQPLLLHLSIDRDGFARCRLGQQLAMRNRVAETGQRHLQAHVWRCRQAPLAGDARLNDREWCQSILFVSRGASSLCRPSSFPIMCQSILFVSRGAS